MARLFGCKRTQRREWWFILFLIFTSSLIYFMIVKSVTNSTNKDREVSSCASLTHLVKSKEFDGRFVGTSETLFLQLISETLRTSFSESEREKMVIADVGANIGLFTHLLCSKFYNTKIYSFEPGDEMRNWLNKKKKTCPQPKNVQVVSKAVSDSDDLSVTLYGPSKQKKYRTSNLKPHNTGASISSGVNEERGSTTVLGETLTVKLDTFFRDTFSILLVKIDTEGLDPLVIKGTERKLEENSVHILYWEFGKHWRAASDHTLSSVVRKLEKYSYESYAVGEKRMIKISNECLNDDILRAISYTLNVFSVLRHSPFSSIPFKYNLSE